MPQTQVNALLNGEIDMLESVNYDHLPVLEKDQGHPGDHRARTSNQYVFRMNWLQPPFNNVRRSARPPPMRSARRNSSQANIGDKRFYRDLQGDVHLRHAARHRPPAWTA